MLYIAVVLYNKRISEIASLENVFSFSSSVGNGNTKLIVVDNSDDERNKSDGEYKVIIDNNIEYIYNNGNIGLSKAYNKALKYALGCSGDINSDYILFVDDDTPFSEEYYSIIYEAVTDPVRKTDGVNVITGIISSGGRSMSPTKGFRFKFSDNDYIKSNGIYEDITCISSGMAVRLDALKKIDGFEEKLFLDMIDYTMLYRLSKKKLCRVLVSEAEAVQNFSGRDEKDKNALLRRYDIYKKDFSTYCKIIGKGALYRNLHLLKRRIAISMASSK